MAVMVVVTGAMSLRIWLDTVGILYKRSCGPRRWYTVGRAQFRLLGLNFSQEQIDYAKNDVGRGEQLLCRFVPPEQGSKY